VVGYRFALFKRPPALGRSIGPDPAPRRRGNPGGRARMRVNAVVPWWWWAAGSRRAGTRRARAGAAVRRATPEDAPPSYPPPASPFLPPFAGRDGWAAGVSVREQSRAEPSRAEPSGASFGRDRIVPAFACLTGEMR